MNVHALSKKISAKYFGNLGASAKPTSRSRSENLFGDIVIDKAEYLGRWR